MPNEPEIKSKTKMHVLTLLSSSGGALITALLMTPMDVIKVRLQSQAGQLHKGDCFVYRNGLMDHVCTCFNGPQSWYNRKIPGGQYRGSFDALIKIVRSEGLTSLWSGLPPTLAMSFPMVVLYFTAYEEAKTFFGYHEVSNPNPALPVISGALARLLSVSFVSPIELIRTKMQSERLKYNEIGDALKKSIHNYGFKSLYRGLVPSLWRDIPFSMIYWLSYETFKTNYLDTNKKKLLTSYETFLFGGLAGSIAATLTCPFDVVKTYRQIQLGEIDVSKTPRKTLEILQAIYKTKGFKYLFTGLIPRVTKVSASCAIMITTFEYFRYFLNED